MSKRNKAETGKTGGFKLARTLLEFIKDEKIKNLVKALIVTAIALLAGFFAGRKTMPPAEVPPEVIYLPGEPIEVEKPYPDPVYIRVPVDSASVIAECVKSGRFTDLFPEKIRDSVVYVTKEDTAAVLKDWATERFYNEKVFDIDTVGSASVAAKVQYNRIESMNVTFVPVQKSNTITNAVAKKYAPFVGGGITTMPEVIINGGIYFDDKYGASVLYEYNWNLKRHAVGVMGTIKF